jgi:hypothetical protein
MIRYSSLPPSELVFCGFAFYRGIPQGPYHLAQITPKYAESRQILMIGQAVRQFARCMNNPALDLLEG